MSVQVAPQQSNGFQRRQSPLQDNRPAPVEMGRIPLPVNTHASSNMDSPNRPSPNIYRQPTMTGSYTGTDSRQDIT